MNLLSSYIHQDAVALGALIRSGDLRPKELVEAALAQIERYDSDINGVAWRRYETALEEAGRPLPQSPVAGVPFLIKGLSQPLKDAPQTMACRMRAGVIADHDSSLVARYKAAGLLIVGQTTSPEFGTSPETRSSLYGVTRNPWKPGALAGRFQRRVGRRGRRPVRPGGACQ